MSYWFRVAYERAGIKGANVHSLRHSFAALFLLGGGDVYTLKELMDIRASE